MSLIKSENGVFFSIEIDLDSEIHRSYPQPTCLSLGPLFDLDPCDL